MEGSDELVPFSFPTMSIETNYGVCTIPSRFQSDNAMKATPTEIYWIEHFRNSIAAFRKRVESDNTIVDAPIKAEKFAKRYGEILDDLEKDPDSHGGSPDCNLLSQLREQVLREVGFGDIFKEVKDEENGKAISLFEDLVHLNDAIEDDAKHVQNLVRGTSVGSKLDLASTQKGKMSAKQSKDPFEAAFEERVESPPYPPIAPDESESQPSVVRSNANVQGYENVNTGSKAMNRSASKAIFSPSGTSGNNKSREEDEEEDEDNIDVELGKFPSSADPDKMAKMQAILSQFTEEQMSRYESFRRSGFQKSNMKRLLASITGSAKISIPMTIVMSGIAKMFVGELVETARLVMSERKDIGPIRPCHIREAYRRLKLEGKIPRRSVPRLFR